MGKLYIYKILILGAYISKNESFLKGLYRSGKGMTLEDMGFLIKSIKTPFNSQESYKLQILELKYNDMIKTLYPHLCKDANCVLILFDNSNPDSLEVMQNWIEMTLKYAGNIPIILIETKSNLENYVISSKAIKNFADQFKLNRLNFKYFNDYNREKLFRQIITIIREHHSDDHFNIFLSNEFNDFKRFDEVFSIYQAC